MGTIDLGSGTVVELDPMKAVGTGKAHQKQYGPLAEILKVMNELLGVGIDDAPARLRLGNGVENDPTADAA